MTPPRWLIVWKYVVMCAIDFAVLFGFVVMASSEPHPRGASTYPVRFRGGVVHYVTPTVGAIQNAALPVAFALMASFALASYLVERRLQPPDKRMTLETIARSPFQVFIVYVIGLCLSLLAALTIFGYRSSPWLLGSWTILCTTVVLVMRRRHRRAASQRREGA